MEQYKKRMETYRSAVESYLMDCFTEPDPQKELYDAMRYSLLAGGKRIRPILTLEFCRLCGGDWQKALPVACAVEMIHTSSLIHDDLPCMDDDDYRRGKLTNHKVYGEATAVLAGDALLLTAFRTISHADIPAEVAVSAIRILSRCSGEEGMVGGQILDMEGENREFTAEEIHLVQKLKTGALIVAACLLGAVCAGADSSQREAVRKYAESIGLAFQTQDDILDVVGEFEKLGKQTGMDVHKNTFVRLYGLDRCREIVREQTDAALDALSIFPEADFLKRLALELAGRDY